MHAYAGSERTALAPRNSVTGKRRDARGSAEGCSCSSRVSIASNNSPAEERLHTDGLARQEALPEALLIFRPEQIAR